MGNMSANTIHYPDAIIPSVTSMKELSHVLTDTSLQWICLKMGDVNTLPSINALIHRYGRKAVIHQDSIKGVAKDKEGIVYFKRAGVDAVITMKSQNVRIIRETGLFAILGSFIVDSSAVVQTLQNLKNNTPDALLVMPMTVPGSIYQKFLQFSIPVIAGGLGREHQIIQDTLDWGVSACIVTDTGLIAESYHR